MKSLLLLIIIFLILSLLPAPYHKTITTCIGESECTTESKIEFGPSLTKTLYEKYLKPHQ